MAEIPEQPMAIVDSTPRIEATLDQVRQQAREAMSTSGRFMACWGDVAADDLTYTMFSEDTGGDAVAFFAFCTARSIQALAAILECEPERAVAAAMRLLEEGL